MDCTNLRNTQFISSKITPQHETHKNNVASTSNNTHSTAPLSTKKHDTETKKHRLNQVKMEFIYHLFKDKKKIGVRQRQYYSYHELVMDIISFI